MKGYGTLRKRNNATEVDVTTEEVMEHDELAKKNRGRRRLHRPHVRKNKSAIEIAQIKAAKAQREAERTQKGTIAVVAGTLAVRAWKLKRNRRHLVSN